MVRSQTLPLITRPLPSLHCSAKHSILHLYYVTRLSLKWSKCANDILDQRKESNWIRHYISWQSKPQRTRRCKVFKWDAVFSSLFSRWCVLFCFFRINRNFLKSRERLLLWCWHSMGSSAYGILPKQSPGSNTSFPSPWTGPNWRNHQNKRKQVFG